MGKYNKYVFLFSLFFFFVLFFFVSDQCFREKANFKKKTLRSKNKNIFQLIYFLVLKMSVLSQEQIRKKMLTLHFFFTNSLLLI
jgi:hypothetical protein